MWLDVLAACPLDGHFALECLEWFSPPEWALNVDESVVCSKIANRYAFSFGVVQKIARLPDTGNVGNQIVVMLNGILIRPHDCITLRAELIPGG